MATMPCPFASNDVTAVASSATQLSSVSAGLDAKRMVAFQTGRARTISKMKTTRDGGACERHAVDDATEQQAGRARAEQRRKQHARRHERTDSARDAAAPPLCPACEPARGGTGCMAVSRADRRVTRVAVTPDAGERHAHEAQGA